jgi:hypothetical protein
VMMPTCSSTSMRTVSVPDETKRIIRKAYADSSGCAHQNLEVN